MVSVTNFDSATSCWVSALAEDERNFSTSAIDLPAGAGTRPASSAFDSRMMTALASNRDACLDAGSAYRLFDETTRPGEVFVTRMRRTEELFVFVETSDEFVASGGGGRFAVEVRPLANACPDQYLPAPLGKVVDEIRVERCTARAYELRKGQFVQIIDVEVVERLAPVT